MGEWQDISTCPEMQTVMLFIPEARSERDNIQIGWWATTANNRELWTIGGRFGFDVGEATHWMPLPPHPTPSTEKERAAS